MDAADGGWPKPQDFMSVRISDKFGHFTQGSGGGGRGDGETVVIKKEDYEAMHDTIDKLERELTEARNEINNLKANKQGYR